MFHVRTILHGTDFSESAHYAFQLACSMARDYCARLIVLHVATPPFALYGGGMVPPTPIANEDSLGTQLKALAAERPDLLIEPCLAEGDVASEILRVARDVNCDVIVLGTHGRTGAGRLLMGSVAEQVMRKAPCPVLTAKMPRPEPASEQEASERELVAAK
jgi:nucleotide-binding universal stress UspA family protein